MVTKTPSSQTRKRQSMDLIDATTVFPGKRDGVHLAQLPAPNISGVPNDRGVLVTVLRCGVDGTDPAISNAEYGAAPEGSDFLVTGHVIHL